ncbi:MAG TPA: nuclear transport factor 2 family protein [Acidimicrobiales bacterium]|nr:nuclear transport factor 2 family protein [Acidimicrobiales bacterium]
MPDPDAPDADDAAHAAARQANAAFYAAFEGRDLDAMSDVWEHTDRATCVHPGWPVLRGWASVAASWFALFDGPQRLQFIVTDEQVHVEGDVAWVTCNENLLDAATTSTVAATNVFVRAGERWRLVHHHGSGVVHQPRPRNS